MIPEEERQSIINEAVERTLLSLPDIVGNLIADQFKMLKLNKKFYDQYPEFIGNKDIVAAVIEQVDSENPGVDYDKLLEKAVPQIRSKLNLAKGLDTRSISKPNRNLASLKLSDHGDL